MVYRPKNVVEQRSHMPVFELSHTFFPEAVAYASTQVCVTFAHYLRSRQSLPPKKFILNRGIVVDSILRNTDEVLLALGTGDVTCPLVYDEADASGVRAGQRPADYRVPPEVWQMITQVCIGSAFERVKSKINARYGRDPWQWPRELEYFLHVRNGCFHGNVFDQRPSGRRTTTINPLQPPRWRTSVLNDDLSVEGKPVWGGVLGAGDVPILLGDIATRLQQDRAL